MKSAPHTCMILFPDWWTLFWRSSCGSCGLREVSIGWLWKGEGHCLQKHPSSPWHLTHPTLMPSQSRWQWPQLWWRPRARIYLSGAVSNKDIQGYIAVIVTSMAMTYIVRERTGDLSDHILYDSITIFIWAKYRMSMRSCSRNPNLFSLVGFREG